MKIARENLIKLLNMDLELEMAAALQYINQAARLSGTAYADTQNVLKGYVYDKVSNAIALAERIHSLGGFPSTKVSLIHISGDNKAMLLRDIEDEGDAIRRLTMRLDQAVQLNEVELSRWLWVVLSVARQHVAYLQERAMRHSQQAHGHARAAVLRRDFAHAWMEKAIKVPVRLKKTNLSQSNNMENE